MRGVGLLRRFSNSIFLFSGLRQTRTPGFTLFSPTDNRDISAREKIIRRSTRAAPLRRAIGKIGILDMSGYTRILCNRKSHRESPYTIIQPAYRARNPAAEIPLSNEKLSEFRRNLAINARTVTVPGFSAESARSTGNPGDR